MVTRKPHPQLDSSAASQSLVSAQKSFSQCYVQQQKQSPRMSCLTILVVKYILRTVLYCNILYYCRIEKIERVGVMTLMFLAAYSVVSTAQYYAVQYTIYCIADGIVTVL